MKINGKIEVDFAAIMERVRRLRAAIAPDDSAERYSKEFGIDVFLGDAVFTSKNTLRVGNDIIKFARCVIASGASPAVPPIPGLKNTPFRTSTDIWNLTALPVSIAVLGAGAIGCEISQAFARFGSKVVPTVIIHRP